MITMFKFWILLKSVLWSRMVACTYHYHTWTSSIKSACKILILLFWAFFFGFKFFFIILILFQYLRKRLTTNSIWFLNHRWETLMTIRLNIRDQLSQRNKALPEDWTSDPWITNPMLSELTGWHLNCISDLLCSTTLFISRGESEKGLSLYK